MRALTWKVWGTFQIRREDLARSGKEGPKLFSKKLPFKNLEFSGNKTQQVLKQNETKPQSPTKPSQCLSSLFALNE